ncbi:hypothetical protein KSP40_PGU007459 [Platanthera guangdongensis]|uniref:aspartate--tRNA ligase n=1 Tax=Platanthera guangdongensis TaxID=2320717 RepID=A0ABR2LXW5_9ASPA
MDSPSSTVNFASEESSECSKKQLKKEALKAEKLRRKNEKAATSDAASAKLAEEDPLSANYGDVPFEDLQSKAVTGWMRTKIFSLNAEFADTTVLIGGHVHTMRAVGEKMFFLVLRQMGATVQCVVTVAEGLVSAQMIQFCKSLTRESIVDVVGVVTIPTEPIKGTTQQVEIQVRKLYCIDRAIPNLPINIEDAARSEEDIKEAEKAGHKLVRVNQDTQLNCRILDLRTPANQAIFRLKYSVIKFFRDFLDSEDFMEIQTPKLIAGASEDGASVFQLDYFGQPAYLAQSPQLHMQMAICAGLGRIFVTGPVFKAKDSYTDRHQCEYIGLDVEMEIYEHYFEVLDIVDRLFVSMFDYLNEKCKELLDAINKQFPFKPLKYLQKTLLLTFDEGVKMLKDTGIEIDPFEDLNTESERTLGRLVLEKYETEFYILHRYPLAVRPFYTMPCNDNPLYSNSFDVFIRGEEVISGAQRLHVADLLAARAEVCGVDATTISTYVDWFRYGAPLHGGFGAELERVVMLFCGLSNIRQATLFPQDPHIPVPYEASTVCQLYPDDHTF